jgi:hypothetical protein
MKLRESSHSSAARRPRGRSRRVRSRPNGYGAMPVAHLQIKYKASAAREVRRRANLL